MALIDCPERQSQVSCALAIGLSCGTPPQQLRSLNLEFDIETGEMGEFIWTEDHDPPELVKPKMKKQAGREGKEEKH